MLSIPVLIAYLVVIAVYLTGCLIIHLRDVHDDKRRDQGSRTNRFITRHGGPHTTHP